MRNKTGVVIAFGVGYYYGARAGRERYEQLDRVLAGVRRSRLYLEARLTLLALLEEGRARAVDLLRESSLGGADPGRDVIDATLEMERPVDPSWN